jgi:hypothetical protein
MGGGVSRGKRNGLWCLESRVWGIRRRVQDTPPFREHAKFFRMRAKMGAFLEFQVPINIEMVKFLKSKISALSCSSAPLRRAERENRGLNIYQQLSLPTITRGHR